MNGRAKATWLPLLLLAAVLPLVTGCGDAVSPATAQSPDLGAIQEQLAVVIERLDALEAAQTAAAEELDAQMAVLAARASAAPAGAGGGNRPGPSGRVEGSLCAKTSLAGKSAVKSLLRLRGRAHAMVGVDGYGNGAVASIHGQLDQSLNTSVEPGISLELQVCGKVGDEVVLADGPSIDAGDPVIALLQELTSSVTTTRLADAAGTVNMDGSGAALALDLMTDFSPSRLGSGFTGGRSVMAEALPLPPALRRLAEEPTEVLGEAAAMGRSTLDLLCDQRLRVGEFAAVMSAGCDLRDDVPPPGDVIDIITGLDGIGVAMDDFETSLSDLDTDVSGLSTQVSTLGGDVNALCSTVTTIAGTFPRIPGPDC